MDPTYLFIANIRFIHAMMISLASLIAVALIGGSKER
jgi:hypothetical protein